MDALISAFTSYGLAGVVIGALFASNWLHIKSSDKRFYDQSERHSEERNLWRDSNDKNTAAIDRNTDVIRTLSTQFVSGK